MRSFVTVLTLLTPEGPLSEGQARPQTPALTERADHLSKTVPGTVGLDKYGAGEYNK